MAASTRVEKLEYKEIPTPKWRIVPLIPNNVHSGTSQEDEVCDHHFYFDLQCENVCLQSFENQIRFGMSLRILSPPSLRKMSVKKRPLPDTAAVKNWSARSSSNISICKLPPGPRGHDGRTPQELIHQVGLQSVGLFGSITLSSHFSPSPLWSYFCKLVLSRC